MEEPLKNVVQEVKKIFEEFNNNENTAIARLKALYVSALANDDENAVRYIHKFLVAQENIKERFEKAVITSAHQKNAIEESAFSFTPAFVDLEKDIHPNGKLLSDKEIEDAKEYFQSHPEIVRKPHDKPGVGYNLLHMEGKIYAIYKGEKQGKLMWKSDTGKVKLMQDLETGKWHVLKIQNPIDDSQQKQIENEYEKLIQAGQLAVPRYGHISDKKGIEEIKISFGISLISGGNLRKAVIENENLDLPEVRWLQIASKILSAYDVQVKDKQLLHRDIKPENIIYDAMTDSITFIDWATAANEEDLKNEMEEKSELVGTKAFIAPELSASGKNESKVYTEKTEVYALGKTIEMLLRPADANSPIKDDTTRNATIGFLNRMTNSDPNKRPSVEDSMRFFKEVLSNHPEALGGMRKIALLDIDEYRKATPEDKLKFKALLQGVDEVRFIRNKGENQSKLKECHEIKRELEDSGVKVSNKIYSHHNLMPDEVISGLSSRLASHNEHAITSYCFVTAQDTANLNSNNITAISVKNTTKEELSAKFEKQAKGEFISASELQYIKNTLAKDILRLKVKYKSHEVVDNRIEAIKETLRGLNEKNNFTLDEVKQKLKSLERKMLSPNAVVHFLQKHLPSPVVSHSHKTLETLKKSLVNEHPKPSAAR